MKGGIMKKQKIKKDFQREYKLANTKIWKREIIEERKKHPQQQILKRDLMRKFGYLKREKFRSSSKAKRTVNIKIEKYY